ncbi:MAG: tRNA lysidine(34) synthetase TilS [Sphingomonadaceae bacterium]
MPSVAPDLSERFRREIERLTDNQGRIGLAVSGGADSLALLLMAQATMPAWISVATVDHGLRPEAAAEAEFVARICATLGIAHTILRPPAPITGSLQAAARTARYALLAQWADDQELAWIATAHHIEDQAETLMMRLLRGSGSEGLSGIRGRNGKIIRPLLGWHRADLRAIVDAAAIIPVDDPTNDDPHYDRVRLRRMFADNPWLNAAALATSANILAETNRALDWSAEREAERRISHDRAGVSIDPTYLPTDLLRRLTLIALRRIDPTITPRGGQLTALIDALGQHKKTTIGDIVCQGGQIWHMAAAPPRRTA